MSKAYIIQHKETKEQFVAGSGKKTWSTPSAAKLAFVHTTRWVGGAYKSFGRFAEQDVYEIVELSKPSDRLTEAESLLLECLGRVDHSVHIKIEQYFNKTGE